MTDLGCRISEDRNECIQRYHGNEDHENEEDELAYERAGEILERVHVEVTEESLDRVHDMSKEEENAAVAAAAKLVRLHKIQGLGRRKGQGINHVKGSNEGMHNRVVDTEAGIARVRGCGSAEDDDEGQSAENNDG